MGKTEEWIARENITRFRKQIAAAQDGKDRLTLERLLAREERRLSEARAANSHDGNSRKE